MQPWRTELAPGRVQRDLIGFVLGLFGGLCVGTPVVLGSDPETALVTAGPIVPISGMLLLRAATLASRRRPRRRTPAAAPLAFDGDAAPASADMFEDERRAA